MDVAKALAEWIPANFAAVPGILACIGLYRIERRLLLLELTAQRIAWAMGLARDTLPMTRQAQSGD